MAGKHGTGKVEHIPNAVVCNQVATNLTPEQSRAVATNYELLRKDYAGKQLINEVYKRALGVDMNLESFHISELVSNKDVLSTHSYSVELNRDHNLYPYVLNKYWSALCAKPRTFGSDQQVLEYDLKTWGKYDDPARRADTIYPETFRTGDILIYTNTNDNAYVGQNSRLVKKPITYENGEYAYIFIAGKGFVGVNHGADQQPGTQDDRNAFDEAYYDANGLQLYSDDTETSADRKAFYNYQTLFGKDAYVILRPSLGIR